MSRLGRILCAVIACVVALAPPLHATDIWVSGLGNDFTGDGSPSFPYRTIKTAMFNANTNDVIKVLTGDYDVNNGEVFPISIKPGVDILGQETDPEDWPRIGGDVADSTVRAIFEVIGNSANGDRIEIVLRKLRFVGENTSGKDAPSAVYLQNSERKSAEVTIDNCSIERGLMDDAQSDDRASIVVVGGDVMEDGEAVGDVHLDIIGCVITPTARGGVEVSVGGDASGDGAANMDIDIRDSSFTLTGTQTSRCAIDVLVDGYQASTGLKAVIECTISGNAIDSRACSTTGFDEGIQVGADVKYGGSVSMPHSVTVITDNVIRGCDGDALRFFADQDESAGSDANIQSWVTARNTLSSNGGNGLCIDFGDGGGVGPGAYMNVRAFCNMIVDNAKSGVCIINMDLDTQGQSQLTSCTMAGNGRYGIELIDSSAPTRLFRLINNIVWDNDIGSTTGWDHAAEGVTFTYNDWQGLFGSESCTPNGDYNVDANPDFEDAANGDYHLKSNSCLLNKGTSTPPSVVGGSFDFDFEGERRVLNGCADIGADEKG